ncbi:hypothetical protein RB196_16050 [Streptomyces sp. PmtA]
MKPHPTQARSIDQRDEQLRDVVWAQRVPVLAGEEQTVVLVRLAPCPSLGVLAQFVGEQRPHGDLVQVDDSVLAGRGLRLAE